MWLCHFTNSLLECKALRALYNRRHKRFTEIQKRFHVRGDTRVKDAMISFLNSKIVLPRKKNALSDSQQRYEILDVSEMEVVSRSTAAKTNSFNDVLLESNKIKKLNTAQATCLKKKTAALCTLGQKNKMLRNLVNEQNRQLKMIGPESKSIQCEVDKLRAKNKHLNQKTRELRDLKIKLKLQQHEMDTINTEMSSLTKVASNALESLDEKENERIKMETKLNRVKKVLFNTKKKVQRRDQNICELHEKVEAARNKFETDKKSIKLYFTGIVDSLKNLHKLSVDGLNQRLEEMKQLETKKGGMYKGEVRLLYYDLLTKGVSANTVHSVVKTVLENMTCYDTSNLTLPSRSTAQRMVSEAGALVKIRTAYELSREKSTLCHQSDGTTKHLIHWGAHAIKLLPNDDPQNPNFFTLTVSPVTSGKADDTVKQLQEQFTELHCIADQLDLDHNDLTYSFMRINGRMSDRAANEKKVTRLIQEKKEELTADIEDASMYETNVYAFTCAAHKVNNMAVAMTDRSAKYLYLCDKNTNGRGMVGARKHIYECNKLLCEHSRKEYGLGNDFKAYSLCSELDTGSELFRPIIGNRYLIFLQNAIPTLAAHDMVLMFLEDIKDAKDNPGLNRLEYSVQQGYLNDNVQAEEIAFSILYFYLCAPLLQKAKSVKSPLEMNEYYASAVGKLENWCRDPSGLVAGNDLLWEGAMGPDIYTPYMTIIRQKACSSDLVLDIIKVMAKAGQEKLRSQAEEHLDGGIYAAPTPAMVKAANTIGDATNDRIESLFGMLDRQMMIAPAMNPVNVAYLIAAKQDKPVEWIKSANIPLPLEKICSVAMKHAKLERQKEGTKNVQIKRRFMEGKVERDAKIKKRRLMRAEHEQKQKELILRARAILCRDHRALKNMNKKQQLDQIRMWRAVSKMCHVKNLDCMKGFTSMSRSLRISCMKEVIIQNQKLDINTLENKNGLNPAVESDWCSSDEETLAMSRPLVFQSSKSLSACTVGTNDSEHEWNSSDEETLDMLQPLALKVVKASHQM
ncbi:hypothetical protein ACJMK2_015873 [Sinanodonta woodiana]|uniref:Uncharacterized protein n=1 Tax=Sinanodonta woodiana TaxID=1069815 RepID=A0ABD3US13_SINWO